MHYSAVAKSQAARNTPLSLRWTSPALVLKGDPGIFFLELKRNFQATRYWLKAIRLQEDRLARGAYEELLSIRNKTLRLLRIAMLLHGVCFSYLWIKGMGLIEEIVNLLGMIRGRKEKQKVQKWLCELGLSKLSII